MRTNGCSDYPGRCAGDMHILRGCAMPHHRAAVQVGRMRAPCWLGDAKGRAGVCTLSHGGRAGIPVRPRKHVRQPLRAQFTGGVVRTATSSRCSVCGTRLRAAKRQTGVCAGGTRRFGDGGRAWGWRPPRAQCAGGWYALPRHHAAVLLGRRWARCGCRGAKGRSRVPTLPRHRAPVRVGRRCGRAR